MTTKAIQQMVNFGRDQLEFSHGTDPRVLAAEAELSALRRAAYILGHASEIPGEEWQHASDLIAALGEEYTPTGEALPTPTPIWKPDPAQQATFAPLVSYEGRPGACPTCDGREFVRGAETGLLGARLEAKPPKWSGTYSTDNLVVLTREATAAGYVVEWTASSDPTWTFGTFTPKPEAPRLRLISAESEEES